VHHPHEKNAILELRLLSFSTCQPHPLSEQPVVFIDKKFLPLTLRFCKIEIVGDFLILLVSFYEWSSNQDIFSLVRWKTGLTYCLASPEKKTYQSFTHLSQDTLVIPNLIQNTFEIVKIVIDNDDTPHFVLLCILHLPPLIQNISLFSIWCRGEPNPTFSRPLVIPSRSGRPFHDKAEDAIVVFNISYDPSFGRQMDLLTLIVHRRALLTHISTAHRACTPFCPTPEPTPAVVDVPWSVWGPPATRLFARNHTSMCYIETAAGQRAVMLEDRMPTPIIVRDFNPYAVRAARALSSASGQSQQGNWSKQLPNGNTMFIKVEDSVLTAGSIFQEDYDVVMMDDESILGFQLNGDGLVASFFDVHVLG